MSSALEGQLWAATAEQRRLQEAVNREHAAEMQARVDGMRAEIERNPDPHALLKWIDDQLWTADAERIRGALAQVLSGYFVALDDQSVAVGEAGR